MRESKIGSAPAARVTRSTGKIDHVHGLLAVSRACNNRSRAQARSKKYIIDIRFVLLIYVTYFLQLSGIGKLALLSYAPFC